MLWAMAVAFCFTGIVMGQEITGSIVGTVRDANGAVVAGATVTISDPSKSDLVVRTLTTNDSGEFTAPNLPISTYTVSVEAANFKRAVNTGIKVDVGARRSVDVTLSAGNVSEVVTVEADPVAVDLTSPTSGTVINGEQVRELSINNRNFTQLVTLAPGVTNDLSDQVYQGTVNPEGQANIVSISVNGARSSQNTFTVDGADITDRGSNLTIQAYPSVDSIGEFRILRSLYPAESGRSGGGQVNVVTRSGTGKFRFSAFEFVRNEKFNANSPLINSQTNPVVGRDDNGKARRPPFRYNNFGFTVGGPIYFLKFGERDPGDYFGRWDKTFFFFSEELRRDRRQQTLTATVPTAGQRQGIFTVPICLQATGTTCNAGAVLPAGTALSTVQPINPLAQQYLNLIYSQLPLPNTNIANQLISVAPNVADFQQEILKIDHAFSDKLGGYYRYQRDRIPTLDVNSLFSSGSQLPGVATTSTDSPGRTHTAQLVYSASPNLIFEGRYTFGFGAILSNNVGLLALSNSPIRPPLPYPNERDRVPTISGNGFSALQSFGPYDNFSWKSNIAGSVTWIAENHIMKFGLMYSKYRKNENALAGNNEGIYTGFNTPGGTGNAIATGGNTTQQLFANFLMGTNVTLTQASFDYTADLRQKAFEAYAQDEFKIRRNLTLYYGVRYSFFGSPWDKNGRLSNFVPELWNPAAAPSVTGAGNRVVGTGNFCNGLIVNADSPIPAFPNCTPTASPWGKFIMDVPKNDFAPRVGMAWDPFGKGDTSVRLGYGIYHEQVLNGMVLQMIGLNPPFQQTCTVTGTRLDNPAPGGCAVIANVAANNVRGIDPNWNTPYMQHWSLDLQRQIGSKTLVTAGYYGSKGTNLIGGFEKNLLRPGQAIARGATGCATGATYIGGPNPTLGPCQVAGTAFLSSAATNIVDQIRPYRGYRSIQMVETRYNSDYHSMQISAQHRFTGASQVNLAYTWAKNLTDAQNDRSTSPQNTYDISLERARAALDRRHVLTVNYIYELPFFRDQRGAAGLLLGGWQVSGIATYQTGLPFTPTVSAFDPSGLALIPALVAGARPNLTCDPNQGGAQNVQQWFNPACFQITPITNDGSFTNTVGNGGRGIINGPSTRRVDLTVSKNFRFSERYRLQLRAEAFNLFNWTNYRALSTVVWNRTTAPVAFGGNCLPTSTCSTFGQVTSYRDPRVIQFAAKVNF